MNRQDFIDNLKTIQILKEYDSVQTATLLLATQVLFEVKEEIRSLKNVIKYQEQEKKDLHTKGTYMGEDC